MKNFKDIIEDNTKFVLSELKKVDGISFKDIITNENVDLVSLGLKMIDLKDE